LVNTVHVFTSRFLRYPCDHWMFVFIRTDASFVLFYLLLSANSREDTSFNVVSLARTRNAAIEEK